jgi:hypothetical protein
MNIFAVSSNTKVCAQALDDKRLIKMVLETAQLLSNAMHKHGQVGPYKLTHTNHPCSIFVAASAGNWLWTLDLFSELANEYYYRFRKTHKCLENLELFMHHINNVPNVAGREPFVNCTTFKEVTDTEEAYRLYLAQKWDNDTVQPKWTKRQQPGWYTPNRSNK